MRTVYRVDSGDPGDDCTLVWRNAWLICCHLGHWLDNLVAAVTVRFTEASTEASHTDSVCWFLLRRTHCVQERYTCCDHLFVRLSDSGASTSRVCGHMVSLQREPIARIWVQNPWSGGPGCQKLNVFLYFYNLRSRPICAKICFLQNKISSDVWGACHTTGLCRNDRTSYFFHHLIALS